MVYNLCNQNTWFTFKRWLLECPYLLLSVQISYVCWRDTSYCKKKTKHCLLFSLSIFSPLLSQTPPTRRAETSRLHAITHAFRALLFLEAHKILVQIRPPLIYMVLKIIPSFMWMRRHCFSFVKLPLIYKVSYRSLLCRVLLDVSSSELLSGHLVLFIWNDMVPFVVLFYCPFYWNCLRHCFDDVLSVGLRMITN